MANENHSHKEKENVLDGTAVPEFFSKLPQSLLKKLGESERYLYEQQSIQGQQNEWLIQESIKMNQRLKEGDMRFEKMELRFDAIERVMEWFVKVREAFRSKRRWIFHATWILVTMLVLPAGGIFMGELGVEWLKHHWHWDDPAVKTEQTQSHGGPMPEPAVH